MSVELIALDKIETAVPQDFSDLIVTTSDEVFNFYWQNIELHGSTEALAKRIEQAAIQDHKSGTPDQIIGNVKQIEEPYSLKFHGVKYAVGPGIYPSNQFRSSRELHTKARQTVGKVVLDYGCSNGFVGLATKQSPKITFVDINPVAEQYLTHSIQLNGYEHVSDVVIGSMPDLGTVQYDTIFFNPPFHLEDTATGLGSSLKDDSSVRIIKNFWSYAADFMHKDSKIICAFSNKDPRALQLLEASIDNSGLQRRLIVHKYADTKSDVRIYEVSKG